MKQYFGTPHLSKNDLFSYIHPHLSKNEFICFIHTLSTDESSKPLITNQAHGNHAV